MKTRFLVLVLSTVACSTPDDEGPLTCPSGAAPFSDARVTAAIALSPTGPGFGGFFDDGEGAATSWDVMRGPLLFATGSNDVKPDKPDLNGPVRRFPYTAQPGDGTRWLLYSNLPIGIGAHLSPSGHLPERKAPETAKLA